MWLFIVLIILAMVYVACKKIFARDDSIEAPKNPPIIWRNPSGAKEHLIMFSVFGEAISSFDSASLIVSYTWGANVNDQVKMTFYGVNNTHLYQGTEVGKYCSSLSGDEWSASCDFEFQAGQGGAPFYFRTNDAVLSFVRKYAPHAEVDTRLSNTDLTSIRFVKHELTNIHLPENLSTTVMRAINN